MRDRLIRFRCVRDDHQNGKTLGTVTVHSGQWAYCASGTVDGHAWASTGGGVTIAELRLGFLPREEPAQAKL